MGGAGDGLSLSDFDRTLISLLEVDGRQSNTHIARKLQVAESTVRRRIDWLVKQGVVQITAQTDPLKIGYPVWIVGQVEIEVGSAEEVVEAIAKFPEVTFIAITTGAYDALFTAIFRNTGELYKFCNGPLTSIKGIRKVESSLVLRLVKRQFRTPMAGVGADNVPERTHED